MGLLVVVVTVFGGFDWEVDLAASSKLARRREGSMDGTEISKFTVLFSPRIASPLPALNFNGFACSARGLISTTGASSLDFEPAVESKAGFDIR